MKVYIGTSGWQYHHWKGKFYPENLTSKDFLKFYSKYFNTVEINTSFYHLTKKSTFEKWRNEIVDSYGIKNNLHRKHKDNFLFAVKLYRLFTHFKKLNLKKEDKKTLKTFLENASALKENLGPILIQLPPSFKDKEVLEKFIKKFKTIYCKAIHSHIKSTRNSQNKQKIYGTNVGLTKKIKNSQKSSTDSASAQISFIWHPLIALEIRNKNLLTKETYNFLKREKITFVISDSSQWPTEIIKTTDTVYIRFHGKPTLFASKYSKKELKEYAKKIKKLKPELLFVYFNNDTKGYAIDNALEFLSIIF